VVRTFSKIVEENCVLSDADAEWLKRLTADWQVIADLAVADLVLWLSTAEGGYLAAALCRPATGPTIYYSDVVGTQARPGQIARFDQVRELGVIKHNREPRWGDSFDVSEEIVPVVCRGRVIAILTRQVTLGVTRAPSRLELNYVEIADEIVAMIARGEFPSPAAPGSPTRHTPRVGDGLLRLNAEGEVLYASPNAVSVCHRIGLYGDIVGTSLADLVLDKTVASAADRDTVTAVAQGRVPWLTEVDVGGTALAIKAVPLTVRGIRTGAVILVRDVTDLRSRELELMT
jgi:hypothetical protein